MTCVTSFGPSRDRTIKYRLDNLSLHDASILYEVWETQKLLHLYLREDLQWRSFDNKQRSLLSKIKTQSSIHGKSQTAINNPRHHPKLEGIQPVHERKKYSVPQPTPDDTKT